MSLCANRFYEAQNDRHFVVIDRHGIVDSVCVYNPRGQTMNDWYKRYDKAKALCHLLNFAHDPFYRISARSDYWERFYPTKQTKRRHSPDNGFCVKGVDGWWTVSY